MYLSKRTYVKNWGHMSPEERHEITVKKNGQEVSTIKKERISEIIEEIHSWRKDNHIHSWFVNNIQDGEDNCREYYVPKNQLQELLDTCKTVKESLENTTKKKIQVEAGTFNGEKIYEEVETFEDTSVAEELLPRQSGFFFGNLLYDAYYLQSITETIDVLEECIKEDGDYYYSSSW
jgi:hypothetical protein